MTDARLTDRMLMFILSLLGYIVTALTIIIVMQVQASAFKLAALLFFPFAVSSLFVCWWYGPKIVTANTLKKSIFRSLLAAFMTSLLTGVLTGIWGALAEAQAREVSNYIGHHLVVVALYTGSGLIYALPGILIGGFITGHIIYRRYHGVG